MGWEKAWILNKINIIMINKKVVVVLYLFIKMLLIEKMFH